MDSEYSFSLTTFNPSGKLVQIEYALHRVTTGAPALGIKAKNGVVLATEKKVPSVLVDDSTLRKTEALSENVGMVYAGMPADYRVLLKRGRKKAMEYYTVYRESPPVSQVVREMAA